MGRVGQARDFFISYTQDDRAWAEWIAWQLEAERYTTVLQAWDFRPGNNFVARMRDALQDADRTIAVLSGAYLASRYGTDEWTSAFLHDASGRQRLLPVRVEACELPRLLATLVYIDLAGVNRATARVRLLDGVKGGRQRPEQEPGFPGDPSQRTNMGQEPRFPGQLPAISNLPPRNPNFTGRTSLLTRLGRNLRSGGAAAVVQTQTVHGLGGVGKTQLAAEYAHRHASDYNLVWWITAEQPAAIPGQLVALARQLGIPEAAEQGETIHALWQMLAGRGRWLLIFDNADDPAHLRPWWPPGGGGRVLVTSRNPAVGDLTAAALQVDVLLRREATSFLRRRGGIRSQAADALADALGDLPLALEQAAAYLRETGTPVEEYLELLRERAPELFALGRPATTQQTIATTWALALERIRAQDPVAQDLLSLCAFLAPDEIPRAVLTEHADVLPERLSGAVSDRIAFQQAMGMLRRYSLVTVVGDTLRLHRLVQAVTRHALTGDDQQLWATTAIQMVLAGFPPQADDADSWPIAVRLLPHALTVTANPAVETTAADASVALLNRVGDYLWGRAEYHQAKLQFERALAMAETRLGPDHPDTATSLSSLATVLADEGDLAGARRLHERALRIRQARLGAEHSHTAQSRRYLAALAAELEDS
jgi:tetratricopeptide (TPR) repeat protein